MNRRFGLLFAAALLSVGLAGCGMRTLNQLYAMPRRPESFYSLQKAMDQVMENQEYSAPLTGSNRQAVQTEDLDGDGEPEYLLFTKGEGEKPLNISIFRRQGDAYLPDQTISCSGTAFEQVEYIQLDGIPGLELVVGCQVSDQLMRTVNVFSSAGGETRQLMRASYHRLLTSDLNEDGIRELMVLRAGSLETEPGLAQLYGFRDGQMEQSQEVPLSRPVDCLKQIFHGTLQDGAPAVFASSSAEKNGTVTDVLALVNGSFVKIADGDDTLCRYPVGAEDVDGDGILELPELLHAATLFQERTLDHQWVIGWYSLDRQGQKTDKAVTFHNFQNGWSVRLDGEIAEDTLVTVDKISPTNTAYRFGIWDSPAHTTRTYMTIFELTGSDWEEQAAADNRFLLMRTDAAVYAARLETVCAEYGINQESLVNAFRLLGEEAYR